MECEAERLRALAEQVLASKLGRYHVAGVTESGRVIARPIPGTVPSEAEELWFAEMRARREAR